ncbi:MAG: hypothetical protein LBK82_17190, partial [Planctomycetaceae bacterium]|jgi:hypothetical protein|nr:hypothetical protein [Planctomycetaceae bacterium]
MEFFPQIPVPIQLAHPHDLLTRYFLIDVELFAGLLENYGREPLKIRFFIKKLFVSPYFSIIAN